MTSIEGSDPARPSTAGRSAPGAPSLARDGRDPELTAMLEESRRLGFLGPGPTEPHVDHGLAFALARPTARAAVDLGSGGGVPGLVLARLAWPGCQWLLLDSMVRRCRFLREAVIELGLSDRVSIVEERAEVVAHDVRHRGHYDVVVARSFGRPAVAAECGGPFLAPGGDLVVSEPPDSELEQRWPTAGLAEFGFGQAELVPARFRLARIPLRTATADRWPRRVGVPAKRPRF